MSPTGFITRCLFLQGSEVLSDDGSLSIDTATFENAGEYVCVGDVPEVPGLTAQASVNLTVKGSILTGIIHKIGNSSQETLNIKETLTSLAIFSKGCEIFTGIKCNSCGYQN